MKTSRQVVKSNLFVRFLEETSAWKYQFEFVWPLEHQKGLFNLAQACIVDGDFWVPNEIDSWNFQHMLLFWFRKASQNLSLFRQLFFHSFQGGTKGKMLKNCQNYTLVFGNFSAFFLWSPLENYEKKIFNS